jgi:BIM1-like copper acquisition factor
MFPTWTLICGQLLQAVFAADLLLYPTTVGFDDSNETIPPCGSFITDFSKAINITFFRVGGDIISIIGTHPTASYLFRATLGQTADNATAWTILDQPVLVNGLGKFCLPQVSAPANFFGNGIIQVISDAPDGLQYQVMLFLDFPSLTIRRGKLTDT